MRVRFILGAETEGDYENRFHMQKEGNSLVVRVDRGEADILGQLLARTTGNLNKKTNDINTINENFKEEKIPKSKPLLFEAKKETSSNFDDLKLNVSKKIKTASYNEKPKWKSAQNKIDKSKSLVKKSSFGLHPPCLLYTSDAADE